MLSHITIKGFKSIASIEKLQLTPINVLIGPNGAGKSNFIEAFTFLHAVYAQRLQNYVAWSGGAERLLHFGSKITREMEFGLSFDDGRNGYTLQLFPSQTDTLLCGKESVSFLDQTMGFDSPYVTPIDQAETGLEARIATSRERIAAYVRSYLKSWRVYHFHDTSLSSPMRKAAPLDDNHGLRADGENGSKREPGCRGSHHRTIQLHQGFLPILLFPEVANLAVAEPEALSRKGRNRNRSPLSGRLRLLEPSCWYWSTRRRPQDPIPTSVQVHFRFLHYSVPHPWLQKPSGKQNQRWYRRTRNHPRLHP